MMNKSLNAYKDANIRDIAKLLAKLEVAGRTEITDDSKETVEAAHTSGYPFEFLKESIGIFIVEELCAHSDSKGS